MKRRGYSRKKLFAGHKRRVYRGAYLNEIAFPIGGIGTGSMHGSPGDVDGDGLLDLLVVDLRHGSLYRQVGPMLFEDVTWASGVGRLLDGLGQWGAGLVDLDLDGDLDLFSANGVAKMNPRASAAATISICSSR